jgi:hypothetical protein
VTHWLLAPDGKVLTRLSEQQAQYSEVHGPATYIGYNESIPPLDIQPGPAKLPGYQSRVSLVAYIAKEVAAPPSGKTPELRFLNTDPFTSGFIKPAGKEELVFEPEVDLERFWSPIRTKLKELADAKATKKVPDEAAAAAH